MAGSRQRRGEDCLSDLKLDRLRLAELDDDAKVRAQEHLRGCARCRARAERLAEAAAAIDADLPRLAVPVASQERPRNRIPIVAAVVLAAAAALFFLLRGPGTTADRDELKQDPGAGGPLVATTRRKGGPAIHIYTRRDGRVQAWAPSDPVRPGDLLAFTYSTDVDRTVAVFDVERSHVALVFPECGDTQPVAAGDDVELDAAVELDDSTAPEAIVAVFCNDPTPTSALASALRRGGERPELPAGCEATVLKLNKSASP